MSTHITYDQQGFPASAYLSGASFVLVPSSASLTRDDPKIQPGNVVPNKNEANGAGSSLWVPWGPGNDHPNRVIADIRKNGVASRALKLRTEMLYGKSIAVCEVVDYDEKAQKEVVKLIKDDRIEAFLKRSNMPVFRNRSIHDFVHLGMIFPMFHLNPDRSEISMVVHDKAAKFRFSPFNERLGRIDSVWRSANWPNPSEDQREQIKAIDSYMYYLEVDRIRFDSNFKYVFPIQSYDLLNDYYARTILESVRDNGWLENSTSIPAIVKSMIKNVMSIKYHIKIPASYWNSLYPGFDKLKDKERDEIVTKKLQEINDFLSGKDNQMKAFISHYMVDKITGKEIAGWEIEAIDDKMKYDSWNGVATTANAEILFAAGINPAIFGLDTPGGARQGGGSDIRESWLTLIASAQGDRDLIYSWWPFVREFNGYNPKAELRTIDQVLTTLDQGKGTAKTLS